MAAYGEINQAGNLISETNNSSIYRNKHNSHGFIDDSLCHRIFCDTPTILRSNKRKKLFGPCHKEEAKFPVIKPKIFDLKRMRGGKPNGSDSGACLSSLGLQKFLRQVRNIDQAL